jgi:LemA protein
MLVFVYLLVAFILICIFLICYICIYNYYQTYIIRINESEAFIDTTLRKRFDLLNKSIGIIEANKKEKTKEEPILKSIVNLKSQKLSNFELDRILYDGINEFQRYKGEIPSLSENEAFLKIDLALFESESEIVSARKYYNDIITDYNKLVRKFPSNIVAKVCNYKVKTYYDGKDMTDDDIQDFKL